MTDEEILKLALELKLPVNIVTRRVMYAEKLIALAREVESRTVKACDDALNPLYKARVMEGDWDEAALIEQCSIAICKLDQEKQHD